jgi:hypothetical protein
MHEGLKVKPQMMFSGDGQSSECCTLHQFCKSIANREENRSTGSTFNWMECCLNVTCRILRESALVDVISPANK